MPRDGSGNYTLPHSPVVDGTTIESAVHNNTMNDIALQLNGPVPIIAGGTGANNAHDAMIALKGEISGQAVTNYDTFPFVSGSFYSAPGATSEPVAGQWAVGICYGAETGIITLEARNATGTGVPTTKYVRQKVSGGSWGAWTEQPGSVADLDARYVNASGDMMTGTLRLDWAGPNIVMNKDLNSNATIQAMMDDKNRWLMLLGDHNTETGANNGSHFALYRYNDAGAMLDECFAIKRDSAAASFTGALTANQSISTPGAINGRDIYAARSSNTGYLFLGSDTTKYLGFDGVNYQFGGAGANIYSGGRFYSSGTYAGFNTSGNGAFTPSTPDGACFVASGGYGGGLTFQDGAGRCSIWGETNDMVLATGAPLARRLTLRPTQAAFTTDVVTSANFSGTSMYITNVYGTGTIKTTADGGVRIEVPAGNYARFSSQVNGVRLYQWGCDPSGNFVLTDESAGAFRLNLSSGGDWAFSGPISGGYGYKIKPGISGGLGANYFNFNYSGGQVQTWIDATNMGNIFHSDYRIKKDVIDLPGMWDTVKALRPIKYTQQQFSPPSQVKHIAEETLKARKEAEENPAAAPREVSTAPLFEADDIERWGFIAHELQAGLLPSAANGEKDAPDTIQSINYSPIIAALTKALQEAMARIEALEAA